MRAAMAVTECVCVCVCNILQSSPSARTMVEAVCRIVTGADRCRSRRTRVHIVCAEIGHAVARVIDI